MRRNVQNNQDFLIVRFTRKQEKFLKKAQEKTKNENTRIIRENTIENIKIKETRKFCTKNTSENINNEF